MSTGGWRSGFIWIGLALLGCGGAETPAAPAPTSAPQAADDGAVHRALVKLHKHAVETCFGGFGKGAPYALALSLEGGTVKSAEVRQLSSKHAPIPVDCVRDAFVGQSLGTTQSSLAARFAVLNDACAEPKCADGDRPCATERDIACSVVIDP